jgi:hypothetical protein
VFISGRHFSSYKQVMLWYKSLSNIHWDKHSIRPLMLGLTTPRNWFVRRGMLPTYKHIFKPYFIHCGPLNKFDLIEIVLVYLCNSRDHKIAQFIYIMLRSRKCSITIIFLSGYIIWYIWRVSNNIS